MSNQIIFICGPTAIGKSEIALKIAKKINGEIINADSMQVYSNLKILTARPTEKDYKIAPHHLYGYVNGSTRYNVYNWCKDISKLIEKNNKADIPSIVVGGTGMYIDKFLRGLIQIPSIPEIVKKDSEILLNKLGIEKFYDLNKKFDEESLDKIVKNDTSRLRRIWEVHKHTNIPFSYWLKSKNKKFISNQKYKIFLFIPERKKIYEKVNKRFNEMISNGAIEEVVNLNSLKLDKSLPIMRAHGVPEISKYIDRLISIDECIEKGQQVTRNYVKRQFTWWRSSNLKIFSCIEGFPNEIDINSLNFS